MTATRWTALFVVPLAHGIPALSSDSQSPDACPNGTGVGIDPDVVMAQPPSVDAAVQLLQEVVPSNRFDQWASRIDRFLCPAKHEDLALPVDLSALASVLDDRWTRAATAAMPAGWPSLYIDSTARLLSFEDRRDVVFFAVLRRAWEMQGRDRYDHATRTLPCAR